MKKMTRNCNNELYAHHIGMTDDRINMRLKERERKQE